MQKATREGRLFCDARGGEKVNIAPAMTGVTEVVQLHQPLVHQCLEAVIGLAVADAQLLCQVPLRNVGPVLQHFEDPKVQVLAELSLLGGHGSGRLPHGLTALAAQAAGRNRGEVTANSKDSLCMERITSKVTHDSACPMLDILDKTREISKKSTHCLHQYGANKRILEQSQLGQLRLGPAWVSALGSTLARRLGLTRSM